MLITTIMNYVIFCLIMVIITPSVHSIRGFHSLLPLGKVTAPTTYSSLTIQVNEETMEKQMNFQEETIKKGLQILAWQYQAHKDDLQTKQLKQNLADLMDHKKQTQAVSHDSYTH